MEKAAGKRAEVGRLLRWKLRWKWGKNYIQGARANKLVGKIGPLRDDYYRLALEGNWRETSRRRRRKKKKSANFHFQLLAWKEEDFPLGQHCAICERREVCPSCLLAVWRSIGSTANSAQLGERETRIQRETRIDKSEWAERRAQNRDANLLARTANWPARSSQLQRPAARPPAERTGGLRWRLLSFGGFFGLSRVLGSVGLVAGPEKCGASSQKWVPTGGK